MKKLSEKFANHKLNKGKMELTTVLILLTLGMFAGVLSGFVGVGGGIIIVPALIFFLGFTQHEAQGTSLALMLPPVGILAVYNYYKSGNLNVNVAIILAVSFIVGAYFGSKASISLDQAVVKKVFGGVMLFVAIRLLFGK